MVTFCQHTKDRPGCPAHPATPPFLQPHPCLLHFHCFCRVFGNLHSGFPSICTNKLKSAAPALSVSPGCLQAHEVQDGNGGPQAGACGAHLGKGMGGALLRLGMIFLRNFLGSVSWPCAPAPGPGLWAWATLRLSAGRLSSGCQLDSGAGALGLAGLEQELQ